MRADGWLRIFTAAIVCCLLGCNSTESEVDESALDPLDQIPLDYRVYMDANGGNPPQSIDDLRGYLDPETLALVESGKIIIRFGIELDDRDVIARRPILAYYAEVPYAGGLIIFAEPLSDFAGTTRTFKINSETLELYLEADDAAMAAEEGNDEDSE